MKKLTYFIILCFACILNTNYIFSQGIFGQTKAYIIKQDETCYIQYNEENILVTKCNPPYLNYYAFKEGLCAMWGMEFSIDDAADIINKLIKDGFKYYNTYNMPVALVLKGDIDKKHLCDWYYNDDYVIYFSKTDLSGNTTDNKCCVMYVKNTGIGK